MWYRMVVLRMEMVKEGKVKDKECFCFYKVGKWYDWRKELLWKFLEFLLWIIEDIGYGEYFWMI